MPPTAAAALMYGNLGRDAASDIRFGRETCRACVGGVGCDGRGADAAQDCGSGSDGSGRAAAAAVVVVDHHACG